MNSFPLKLLVFNIKIEFLHIALIEQVYKNHEDIDIWSTPSTNLSSVDLIDGIDILKMDTIHHWSTHIQVAMQH